MFYQELVNLGCRFSNDAYIPSFLSLVPIKPITRLLS